VQALRLGQLRRAFPGWVFDGSCCFDKTYVTLCQDIGCHYGLRRNVIATLRYRW